MASSLTKVPIIRAAAISTRGYAQAAPVNGVPNYEVQTSTLPNKLVVASADNQASLARVSIVFKAGSRNETSENLGVAHVLRICAGLTTKNATQFAIARNIQQLGASLTASQDRETISYTLEGTPAAVEEALPYLTEVATQQVFRPWEVAENSHRLRIDLATRPLQLRAIDLLHKAAYRRGLGNSLYVPKFQIGKISTETLQHFVANNCTSARGAVVGWGVNHSQLSKFAQCLQLPTTEGADAPSPYAGGEVRSDKGSDLAFVALAGEGGSLKNTKEALAFAVAQRALGAGPSIKWSTSGNSPLSKALGGGECVGTAINASYSDTGLFGILLAVPSKSAKPAVEGALNLLKSGNVTDEDVNRGKNQLKTALLLERESGTKGVQCLGVQAALTRQALSASQLAAAVDSINTSDVRQALSKAGKGKLTIASVGNLSNVPYLDELK